MNILISKRFTFEASHILPLHPGKCSRLHGHSWGLTVSVLGPVDRRTGMVVDFADLGDVVKHHIIDKLDHQHLGCGSAITPKGHAEATLGDSFYPTSENLVVWIADVLEPLLRTNGSVRQLAKVELEETCTSSATWHNPALYNVR